MSSYQPGNPTNLSGAGVIKWFLIVLSLPCCYWAWNGIVRRDVYASDGLTKLTGAAAAREGWISLGYAGILWIVALLIWFIWQRNED